jgi:hypothetical protein
MTTVQYDGIGEFPAVDAPAQTAAQRTVRLTVTALLWAPLVCLVLLQHVTWSVNSLCHLLGDRPFTTRRHDRATSRWPLAVLSLGGSWRNMHHSDPGLRAARRRLGAAGRAGPSRECPGPMTLDRCGAPPMAGPACPVGSEPG